MKKLFVPVLDRAFRKRDALPATEAAETASWHTNVLFTINLCEL